MIRTLPYPARVAVFAAAYFLAAKLGLAFAFVHPHISVVWPATGVALAFLFVYGMRHWPAVTIGAVLVHATSGAPVFVGLGMAAGSTAGALITCAIVKRFSWFRLELDRFRDVGILILGCIVGALVNTILSVATLVLGDYLRGVPAIVAFQTWWLGRVIGGVVVGSFLTVLSRRASRAVLPGHVREFCILIGGILLLGWLVFGAHSTSRPLLHPLGYIMIPLVIWGAIRFGQLGGLATTVVVAGIAVWHTSLGHGVFVRDTVHSSLITVQVFIAVVTFTAFMVASLISERRRAEELLASSEASYRSLFESITDAVYIQDREGRFLDINPAVCAMYGMTREEIVGQSPAALADHAKVDMEATRAHFQRALAGAATRYDWWGRRKNGESFPQEVSLTKSVYNGDEVVIAVARDLSDRQRLQTQMQQAQKLESLGVLAGGIAHDFNNLLAAVLGNASLVRMQLPTESPLQAHVRTIETAAVRAAELTRQMLAYSGRGKFMVQQLGLSNLVDEMATLLASVISKKATLKFHFADQLPLVEGDATQLRQVVMNLITNASDAIGDRPGTITVSTGVMFADEPYLLSMPFNDGLAGGKYVYLEVADTGIGMDAETQGRIFDPFYTTKFTGRGLGLAATLGIVRGHRGAIKVASTPGEGSIFRLLLPAAEATNLAPELAPVQSAPLNGWRGHGTVLVVDDEPSVRLTAARALETAGFSVLTAADGSDALEVFRRNADDIVLVLLDMMMPNLNGEETFVELRKIRSDVRVILSSGYDRREASRAVKGLAGFLQKPYRHTELIAAVRDAMARQNAMVPASSGARGR